jgi:hypothetical protein
MKGLSIIERGIIGIIVGPDAVMSGIAGTIPLNRCMSKGLNVSSWTSAAATSPVEDEEEREDDTGSMDIIII